MKAILISLPVRDQAETQDPANVDVGSVSCLYLAKVRRNVRSRSKS